MITLMHIDSHSKRILIIASIGLCIFFFVGVFLFYSAKPVIPQDFIIGTVTEQGFDKELKSQMVQSEIDKPLKEILAMYTELLQSNGWQIIKKGSDISEPRITARSPRGHILKIYVLTQPHSSINSIVLMLN